AVLEAEIIAWGATGRNAGFVVPNFAKMDPSAIIAHLGAERGERLIDFAAGSADLVFDLVKRHGIDCDAVQNGWIQPAHSAVAIGIGAGRQDSGCHKRLWRKPQSGPPENLRPAQGIPDRDGAAASLYTQQVAAWRARCRRHETQPFDVSL